MRLTLVLMAVYSVSGSYRPFEQAALALEESFLHHQRVGFAVLALMSRIEELATNLDGDELKAFLERKIIQIPKRSRPKATRKGPIAAVLVRMRNAMNEFSRNRLNETREFSKQRFARLKFFAHHHDAVSLQIGQELGALHALLLTAQTMVPSFEIGDVIADAESVLEELKQARTLLEARVASFFIFENDVF